MYIYIYICIYIYTERDMKGANKRCKERYRGKMRFPFFPSYSNLSLLQGILIKPL